MDKNEQIRALDYEIPEGYVLQALIYHLVYTTKYLSGSNELTRSDIEMLHHSQASFGCK